MSILIFLVSILIVLIVDGLIIYFIYRKTKKYFVKMFDFIKTLDNKPKKTQNQPIKDHFQQELEKIKGLLENYKKK